MKNPSIENVRKYNENILKEYKDWDLLDKYESEEYIIPRAMGWVDAFNYITRNYKLEEK